QFAFITSSECVPVGKPLEFVVTSADVNHGLGIFGPDGRLVGQVQAMPGFTNVLRVQLDTSGQYFLRCLELCGVAHHVMARPLQVGCGGCGSGASAGC
ncbi:MAG: cytochrome oxidase, partial [Chloroflexota bacterium]|nr:cytochrome oxidase [Chloroflexota bacterium]